MFDVPLTHSPTKGSRMQLRHLPVGALAIAALAAVLSCSDTTAPDGVEERAATDLRLLAAPYGTPPLASTQASFYAVKGRVTGADIWYHAKPGRTDSTKFLEFRLGTASLDRRPDGTLIAPGDSVLITLTVTDPTHFIIDLQPSGLIFASSDQPRLRISFAACGDDLNYDGRVDATDATMQASLSVWRQEAPFQSWFKVSSTVTATTKDVDALLGGFTGYALMY
jgi:hypothetical protein